MNIHKRLDRFAQWSKEKTGAKKNTGEDEEFKALQQEMNQRHEGMQKLHGSMNAYVKHLNRRTEGDSKEKATPVGHLGGTMSRHGQDFEPENAFGQCLSTVGQANERIARVQDSYAMNATNVWLESMERSLAQMKEYQSARKKLEQRRLAYDTSLGKSQRAKKDDYAAEEELRSQRAKYEETAEDVTRRMQDIIDSEGESMNDLYGFLENELNYYDRCREILLQAKQSWPVPVNDSLAPRSNSRRPSQPRSRQNTLSRVPTHGTIDEDETLQAPVAPFRISSRPGSGANSPRNELPGYDFGGGSVARATPLSRATTNESIVAHRGNLRPVKRQEVFSDGQDETGSNSSGDGYMDRADSPATTYSQGGASGLISRNGSWSTLDERAKLAKKAAPPPPPPSRSTKPKPPPPPPMKRNAVSSGAAPTLGV